MSQVRLNFYSPTMSKATLAEAIAPVVASSEAITVDLEPGSGELRTDPATVALIAAAGHTVAALIQAVAQVYLKKKATRDKTKTGNSATVTVFGTLGDTWTIELNEMTQFSIGGVELPSDPDEIVRIRLE